MLAAIIEFVVRHLWEVIDAMANLAQIAQLVWEIVRWQKRE